MKLTIICSWCGVMMGEKDCDFLNESLPRMTHSICFKCHSKVLDDLNQSDTLNRNNKSQLTIERRL